MAPNFEIQSIRNTGRTDGDGDDTLYVVTIADEGGEPETVRFSVDREGPSEEGLRDLIERRAAAFANDRGALEQFREIEHAHPKGSERRVVFLSRGGS